MIILFRYSFLEDDLFKGTVFVGFDNFVKIFTNSDYYLLFFVHHSHCGLYHRAEPAFGDADRSGGYAAHSRSRRVQNGLLYSRRHFHGGRRTDRKRMAFV